MSAIDLLADDTVLLPVSTLGIDVTVPLPVPELITLHTRRDGYLRARRAGLAARAYGEDGLPPMVDQAVIVAEKSRRGTLEACASACRHLTPEGRLLLVGENILGIRSTAKRLASLCGITGATLACRAHARVEVFDRPGRDWEAPASERVTLPLPDGDRSLLALPGVFSQNQLDAGTLRLLQVLGDAPPPHQVIDLCCGIGPLGIAALLRWPACRTTFLDGDARAILSLEANLLALGLMERADCGWWDAHEGIAGLPPADLVLLNPPWHDGKSTDVALGRHLISQAVDLLRPQGHALVVANRRLPYEDTVGPRAACRVLTQAGGYKLLLLSRS